ncbi:T-cell-specific guanine nucleotide triphosphate-binding protein 2-like isoform X2 [Mya arenaria]|uniref:T-cell-specific guanine nucleotide triphosphate-binding protein 2-like isoform X2 n=1 Tax=Mya arenaria TaxID=6604 RepID=UPI0022E7DF38|nr:T-cell-specific guanine nucleotide triphosphate-binding protein 2-like isoform X2 [Mya arenaria]
MAEAPDWHQDVPPVTLAVLGRVSVGKTTLVRLLSGGEFDPAIAPTRELTVEQYSRNSKIVICDLPGYGSVSQPVEMFIEQDFTIYDGFIFVCRDKLDDDDHQVLKNLPRSKRLNVVRCVSDSDSDKDLDSLLGATFEDFALYRKDQIFLVDSRHQDLYGFPQLVSHLDNGANFKRASPSFRVVGTKNGEEPPANQSALTLCEGSNNDVTADDDDFTDIKSSFESGGAKYAVEQSQLRLGRWKSAMVNIGITGNSGVGKSSFINAVRGLVSPDEQGWAKVNVVEETKIPTPYEYPMSPNVKLWDMPGIGTKNFTRENYLEKVNFDKYDIFIIVCAVRFTGNDLWLARDICSRGKKFIFVRAKVGQDIENERKVYTQISRLNFREDIVLKKIRADCQKNLAEFGKCRVFLIDNFEPHSFDFGELAMEIINITPSEKQEAVTMSMPTMTEGVIQQKVRELQKRIWLTAIPAALADAVSIPNISASLNEKCLLKEAEFYREQFGLTDEALAKNAVKIGVTKENFVQMAKLRTTAFKYTGNIVPLLKTLGIFKKVSMSKASIVLWLTTTLVNCGVSYTLAVSFLRKVLEMTAEDARRVNNEMTKPRR